MARIVSRTSTLGAAIDEALSTAEELRDELQEWKDNLPENLQDGQKADELQEAIDYLEEGISALEEAQGGDDEILNRNSFNYGSRQYSPSEQRSLGRAKRLASSMEALESASTEISDYVEDDEGDEFQTTLDSVQEAIDALSNVNFPGMF